MTATGLSRAGWRTSSYSGANGDCVEVAPDVPAVIAVRDSQDPAGPQLAFPAARWTAFTGAVKRAAACR
jgi:hypothetical protein